MIINHNKQCSAPLEPAVRHRRSGSVRVTDPVCTGPQQPMREEHPGAADEAARKR